MTMFLPNRYFALHACKITIILIANYLLSTSAISQNKPLNAANASTQASTAPNDAAERARIQQNRADAETAYAAEKKACYQRFAVSGCLAQARDLRSSRFADLKRQEVSLNDMQRKRLGVEQLQRSEDKTSPEQQQAVSERRGQALVVNERRKERLEQQSADRHANAQAAQSRQKDTTGRTAQANSKAAAHQARMARAAQNEARYEARQRQAQVRRNALAQRQKNLAEAPSRPSSQPSPQFNPLKKPSKSAAPLPIPVL